MTPSFSGRTATMLAGVRPTIRFASAPTARIRLVRGFIATTDGSLMTMPLPRTSTSVFAVPRSMPMSRERRPKTELNGLAISALPVGVEAEPALAQAGPPGLPPADDDVVEDVDV